MLDNFKIKYGCRPLVTEGTVYHDPSTESAESKMVRSIDLKKQSENPKRFENTGEGIT